MKTSMPAAPAPDFWRGKRVFLTGHTGFKGGWLALWLKELGASVYGYALKPPTVPNLFTLARIKDGLAGHTLADICDAVTLRAAIKASEPDIIMHLAAQPILRLSYDSPVDTYATNIMGTVNVLEAARHQGTARVTLIVTTDKCYENREQMEAYRENDPMGGHDPYSSSKACAELVTSAYGRSFFTKGTASVASLRAGNVIGGGDWAPQRLMTDIVAALAHKKSPVLRNPHSVRPWQHVLEPLSGYLLAAERLWRAMPKHPETWNFGPDSDSEVSVLTVANHMCRLWGGDVKPQIEADPHELHEAKLLRLDSRKAKTELEWRPRLSLTEALTMTADWYRQQINGGDMHQVTVSQIAAYQDLQNNGDFATESGALTLKEKSA